MYVEFERYLLYTLVNKSFFLEKYMNSNFYKKLITVIPHERVKTDEPMRGYTTFRVGGPADFLVEAENKQEIKDVIVLCKAENIPYYIVGNGSNLLVSDEGYRGVIIHVFKNMSRIAVCGNRITAQAGALLSQIAARALDAGLTGFEFAAGIPGTLGGACRMNAGAYGGELKDVLEEVTVLDDRGEICSLSAQELEMGYRTSVIAEKEYVVLEAVVALEKGDKEKIREYMLELKERRVSRQPLEYPSAGSTFKRPQGYFAGKLIEDTGLRGFCVGDAQVSEKHCGFVINRGNASASEINELMKQVSDRVEEKFEVRLEPEVRRLGEF